MIVSRFILVMSVLIPFVYYLNNPLMEGFFAGSFTVAFVIWITSTPEKQTPLDQDG